MDKITSATYLIHKAESKVSHITSYRAGEFVLGVKTQSTGGILVLQTLKTVEPSLLNIYRTVIEHHSKVMLNTEKLTNQAIIQYINNTE